MPRELVHWEILLSCVDECRSVAPQVGSALQSFPGVAQWGSLVPDAPYYHRFGSSAYEGIAEAIHGSGGEDAYEVPRALLASAAEAVDIAFGFGFLTHCVVDAVFHPMIYFFTGDYYHESPAERLDARRRHRAFEVYLDRYWKMHHCSEARLAFALPRIYREFAPYSEKFCNRLEEVAPLSDAEVWKESFRDFYRAMRLCTNWGTGMLLTLFNRLADRRFQGEQALLSFGRQRVPQWLGDIHEFRNPANGVTCNLGLRELRQQARATILGLAVEVEEFISSSETQRPQTRFATRIGPSLNTGLIGSKKADMRFFDVKELS